LQFPVKAQNRLEQAIGCEIRPSEDWVQAAIGAGLAMRYGGAMVVAVESGDKSVGYAFS
jgi:hypothetical protein